MNIVVALICVAVAYNAGFLHCIFRLSRDRRRIRTEPTQELMDKCPVLVIEAGKTIVIGRLPRGAPGLAITAVPAGQLPERRADITVERPDAMPTAKAAGLLGRRRKWT